MAEKTGLEDKPGERMYFLGELSMFTRSRAGSRRGKGVRMQKRTEKNRAEKLDKDVDECTAHRRVVIRKEMREHVR